MLLIMKKLLGIIVLGLLLSGNAYAEIINLNCSGYKGYGDFSTFNREGNDGDLKFKIDTQKKTYEFWAKEQPKWVKMIILDWQGTSIKAKDPNHGGVELFNYANYKIEMLGFDGKQKANGYLQYNCNNEQAEKIKMASMIDKAKGTCKSLGFKEGTEKFSDCALKLYSQSVELAAEKNQTVVMQPQSSGSNVMTIYDPVRDSNALIKKGQRMLSGACTLGIDC